MKKAKMIIGFILAIFTIVTAASGMAQELAPTAPCYGLDLTFIRQHMPVRSI